MAARGDRVWVACCAFKHGRRPAGMLLEVDARRQRVGRRVPATTLGGIRGIVATADAVWVTTGDELVRVDPARVPA